jgi:hypothetical protein
MSIEVTPFMFETDLVCPTCNKEDNGDPLIECDLCKIWYHQACQNVRVTPGKTVKWSCMTCLNNATNVRSEINNTNDEDEELEPKHAAKNFELLSEMMQKYEKMGFSYHKNANEDMNTNLHTP